MNNEIDMIAHSCGVRHARELRREHVRIVGRRRQSVALNMLFPYPETRRPCLPPMRRRLSADRARETRASPVGV